MSNNFNFLIKRQSYETAVQRTGEFLRENNVETGKMYLSKAMELAVQLCNNCTIESLRQKYVTEYKMLQSLGKALERGENPYYVTQSKNNDNINLSNTASKNSNASSTANASNDQSDAGKGEINYIINGVNVEAFLVTDSNEVVMFDDVKGMTEEKALIKREFFLTAKQREFNKYLGKKPKTFILLYGVPGTGKTFFAKAISGELKKNSTEDIPFFSVVGSQLSDCKVGATERNIQAVFEFCKQFEHCVLYIDEFDSLAPDRKKETGDPTAGSRVTTLLQMMDGFASSQGTLVIAATNCPYNLDGAVLSRANTRIEIPLPSYEVIYATLNSKIGDKIASDVDLSLVSARLEELKYSNRDIKNFIGDMVDSLSSEFGAADEHGDQRDFEEFKYTNEMIERAFERIVPTTKPSDVKRIEEFKLSGE